MNIYLKNKLIMSVIVVVVFVAILILVIIPTFRDIGELKHKILIQKAELEERYNRRIGTKLTLQNLKNLKPTFAENYNKVFAKSGQEIEFINKLEELAIKHHLEQQLRLEVALKTKLDKGPEAQVPISLDLTGKFTDLVNYMYDLERITPLIVPFALEVRQTGFDYSPDNVIAKIQAKTFWLEL